MLTILSFVGYRIWHAYYLAKLPPIEEKANVKFGILPKPDFPRMDVSSSNYSYSLDTTTGGLPRVDKDPGFEKIIKVYFVTQTFATLLSPDRSQALADKFGFTSPPVILSETKYKYIDGEKQLLVDLNSGNFSYTNEASISAKINTDDNNKLVTDFKNILSKLDVLKKDLQDGRDNITFLKTSGDKLIPTELPSEAMAARISLWPASIEKKSIFTSDFDTSMVTTTVSGETGKLEEYRLINFTYYPIDTSTYATYPIKTAESAFEDLKNGKGVIIIEPSKSQVSITSVFLGYYMPENYSPYLQPIFIFKGPHFAAYVGALPDEFQSQGH